MSAIPRNAAASRSGRAASSSQLVSKVQRLASKLPLSTVGDVARMQRLQRAQVVPIKKMAFETLEPTQRFERAEVARLPGRRS